MIVYLAWFSSVTHLATLTFLRHFFYLHRAELRCRVIAMFLMLVLLCTAMAPTSHFTWQIQDVTGGCDAYDHADCPQACDKVPGYYGRWPNTKTPVFQNLCLSIFLLCYGYIIRLAKMSPYLCSKSQLLIGRVKQRATEDHESWTPDAFGTPWKVFRTMMLQPLWIALLHCIILQVDFFTSMFAEVRDSTVGENDGWG